MALRDDVGEEEMIFFEMRILKLLSKENDVVFGRSDEVDGFKMHEFFLDIFYLLDKIDIIFIEFRLCVDDGDDT